MTRVLGGEALLSLSTHSGQHPYWSEASDNLVLEILSFSNIRKDIVGVSFTVY